eukprot:CAMPEP_0185596518 /NCGR_PEP_ID=MMETSP0434-20130131/80804_1 /TAXON_ID=626734 ORGANISM="Favella taraikaensis, Strain Fe Narragansett Bay" /NCGR_SAMPLE_ID=MMETSP0434 /ASSEMBLY_ACC=CAM_ASM_000379 /LENGTH=76 /DNA_ID=CAMNT_0028225037 /DNA_START=1567 /DNA_END=1797 /DNA_ORIENTATION=-
MQPETARTYRSEPDEVQLVSQDLIPETNEIPDKKASPSAKVVVPKITIPSDDEVAGDKTEPKDDQNSLETVSNEVQ